MNCTDAHPAVALGDWLRAKRRSQNIVARVFAQRVGLTHAQYAEVEVGVGSWLGEIQAKLIPLLLELTAEETLSFQNHLAAAKAAEVRKLTDAFSHDELRPIRAWHLEGKQLSKEDEDRILKAVFEPIA